MQSLQQATIPIFLLRYSTDEIVENRIATTREVIPDLVATGFVLSVGVRRVMVTAAHVVDMAEEGYLVISHGDRFVTLPKRWHITKGTPNNRSKDDKLDFAFVDLKQIHREALRDAGSRFISLDEIAAPDARDQEVVITGYPAHRSKPDRIGKVVEFDAPMVYCSSLAEEEYRGFDNDAHIFVKCDQVLSVAHRKPIHNFSFIGASGGPVWGLPTIRDFVWGHSPTLLGLVTERIGDRRQRIAATRASIIATQVTRAPSDLEAPER
jgi:hypothetical protein